MTSLTFGSDGKWLAVAADNGDVRIYDLEGGRLARKLLGAGNWMAVHPSKKALAISNKSGAVTLYDVVSGDALWNATLPTACRALQFAPDGRRLYMGCSEPFGSRKSPKAWISIRDANSGREISVLPTPSDIVRVDAFSAGGQWYAGMSIRSVARFLRPAAGGTAVVETASGRKLGEMRGAVSAPARGRAGFVLSSNGRLAALGADFVSHVEDLGPYATIADISPDGSLGLYVRGDMRGALVGPLLDFKTGNTQPLSNKDLPRFFGAAISPDKKYIAIALAEGGGVMLLSASDPGDRRIIGKPGVGFIFPPATAFLEAGRLLAVRARDNWWDVWDVTTGNRLPFRKQASDVYSWNPEALLKPDELNAIEAAMAGLHDAAAPPVVADFPHVGEIVCKSEDGRFDVEISRESNRLQSAVFRSVDGFSFDLLASGMDLTAWDREPPRSQASSHPYLCSINRDGTRLVVDALHPGAHNDDRSRLAKIFAPRIEDGYEKSSTDGLTLYDSRTGRKVCDLENEPGASSFDALAGDLHFTPDGKLIVGGGNWLRSSGLLQKRRLRMWDTGTCRRLIVADFEGWGVLGFSADGRQLLTGMGAPSEPAYGVRVWDVTEISGTTDSPVKPLFEIPEAIASARVLITSPNHEVLIGPNSDGAVGLWNRQTGRRLGTLRPLEGGEWLVTTPSGFFDGSPRGWNDIAWRAAASDLTTSSGEIFFNEFYRPGLLADLIEGREPQARRTLSEVDRRQARVSIASVSFGERTAPVHITVEESPTSASNQSPAGVRDLRLFRNGLLVKAWRGDLSLIGGKATFDEVIPLVAGENRLVAYAFNHDNVKSPDAEVVVTGTAPARRGAAYILAIGINRYANAEFNLNFAAPDAMRLSDMLARSQQHLGTYSKVVAVNLLDDQATRANVLIALSRLAGGQTAALPAGAPKQLVELEPVQPEDTVVVFFAGHGTAFGDRFYLIPHDLGYTGHRDLLWNSLQKVLDNGISDQDLERVFEPVDAANILLIIDACNSGKALDAEDERRGPLNSKGLAQLAYEKGMYILTAAQAYQAAVESSRLGHGYLTFALVEEGLTTAAADVKPADGQITAVEWFDYATRRVPQLQLDALREAAAHQRALRFETDDSIGGTTGRLQTPRLYYRREAGGAVPVIAKWPSDTGK